MSEPEPKNRAAGHYYLSNKEHDGSLDNGAVIPLSKLTKHGMTFTSEAEVAALFYNSRAALCSAALYVALRIVPCRRNGAPTTKDPCKSETTKQRRDYKQQDYGAFKITP